MPKSKKPRRKYRPNPRGKIIWYSPLDAIDNFVDMFTNIELVCETKLPRGNCSRRDVEIMMDLIQWGKVFVADREYFTEESRLDAQYVLHEGAQALSNVIDRGLKNEHFVCTGNELNAIRDAVDFVGPLVKQAIKESPSRTAREWRVMLRYSMRGCEASNKQVQADVNRA